MTNYETIRCMIDARGVATVELNRPAVYNAFDETMIAELAACFGELSASANVRVVLLAAVGKVFCAGADLNWMRRASANTPEANRADAQRLAAMMEAIYRCPKPVVARVQGSAFGGGVGLICAADIVIAGVQARLSVTEARFGILPAAIGPYLIEAIGVRAARALALTAAPIDAAQAQLIGLVQHVSAAEALDDQVNTVIGQLLANGPNAQAEIKKLFATLAGQRIDAEVSALTAATIARVRATDEAREGFAAFFDKRPAAWNKS
jgi:methylglutaconyl-CoA hydratase